MDRRRRGGRLPDWVYYAFAAAITLLTIPMYRVLLHPYVSVPSSSGVVPGASAEPVYVRRVVPESSAEVRKPLLPGELCEGGYVILKSGNSYTQGMDRTGRPSRCSGGYLIEQP
ncbi:hypothetical protein [Dyella psychrodurans]|uniref:hypothetical protein n=1 Tax=Dyella psychrodurans TaxID=1927960 RepID=UPI0011C060A1|nr:hypothetical protein [Dyella psychrodurans]